jgi:hypothetical protein
MQIVIDIPQGLKIDFENENWTALTCAEMKNALMCGTPLPKGHGRLIDADRIIAEATERMKYPANHKYMECVIAHMNLAPTIIEADTESEE